MIVVIQCAASKKSEAGRMMTAAGKPVLFVAVPEEAPAVPGQVFTRPDDLSDSGVPWRRALLRYNEKPENNPFGLSAAYRLYKNGIYERLVDRFGILKCTSSPQVGA
jgi:hypothetical protein